MSRASGEHGESSLDLCERFEDAIRHMESDKQNSEDDRHLRRLGKKPALKRSFGFMSILGFSCTVLITWEGALILCSSALLNGGTAGVLWGFLICWLGIWSAFATIAELASMAPISSGQYHWIAILSAPSMKEFFSFMTAWVTVLGWQAAAISSAFLNATVIQGTVALTHRDYTPQPWQTLLVTWAILAFAVVLNTISSRLLANFEGAILIVHLLGFFGILIPLVYFGPHGDASVFTTLNNGGGWSSAGLSFIVGLPSLVFALFGADSAVHMSEEIQNASMAVPQALIVTMVINGSLGFAMMAGLMFCIGDVSKALEANDKFGFAYIGIFEQAVQSRGGAAAMSAVVVTLGIFGTVGTVATSTRLLWAFARDKGLPFSKSLAKLHSGSTLPLNAVFTTIAVSVLLSLISLGSSLALNDVLNLSIAGLFSSYLIVCAALLVRRLQGKIRAYDDELSVTGPESLRWGPWRIPEPLGTLNNIIACLFLAWILFWTFWPPYAHVTPAEMNYNVLVFGGTVLFGVVWYFVKARKYYQGPVIELT